MRLGDEEMSRQDVLHHRSGLRQGQAGVPAVPAFVLQKAVGQRGQHDVPLPAGQRAALEVIEPELVFQLFVLLFDRPALMCQPGQRPQAGGRGQIDQVELGFRRGAEIALAEQPHLGREAPMAPVVRRGDPQGR